jgi:hypothetical protein
MKTNKIKLLKKEIKLTILELFICLEIMYIFGILMTILLFKKYGII